MIFCRLCLALSLLAGVAFGGAGNALAGEAAAPIEAKAMPGRTQLAQAPPAPPQAPPSPTSPPAAPASAASDEPIGNVAAMTGVATVVRNKDSIPLKLKDDIYLNDTVATAASSSLGITFNDATTFNLKANARITIDEYVYEDNGKNNAAAFDIAKGTVAFVAAAVAKTGNMSITTPTASLGIRGTTGLVEVPEGAAASSANNVNIKLYPDPDGRVGRIEVNDRSGARLGALTQGASGFAIRPGGGGARLAAVPLTISPQQAQRDQGFVRQVHATQNVGRQIVTEQRAFRRANPGLNRGNQPRPPGQPGQPRPNGLPGQTRPGAQPPAAPKPPVLKPPGPQQPGTPKRQGLQQPTPGGTAAPGQKPRPGQNPQQGVVGQPGTPSAPVIQPKPPAAQQAAPGSPKPALQRPGLQNRPAPPRRPAKGKKEKR